MTRVLLSLLAVGEAVLGMFGLITTLNLFFNHGAGMTMVFLPVLALTALLLLAGAAIFVRKPWSYWVHIAAILLVGVLAVLYIGPLVGADTIVALLPVVIVIVLLTVAFFLTPVRRYFGIGIA
jgi:hypothetical protein